MRSCQSQATQSNRYELSSRDAIYAATGCNKGNADYSITSCEHARWDAR
jgi:hypothetical protein